MLKIIDKGCEKTTPTVLHYRSYNEIPLALGITSFSLFVYCGIYSTFFCRANDNVHNV